MSIPRTEPGPILGHCESCCRQPATYQVLNPDGPDFQVCTSCAPPAAAARPQVRTESHHYAVTASHLVRSGAADGTELLSYRNDRRRTRHLTAPPARTARQLVRALLDEGHDVSLHTITDDCFAVFEHAVPALTAVPGDAATRGLPNPGRGHAYPAPHG